MSIQMTLVFATLCGEMIVLFGLVLPLPHIFRTKILQLETLLRSLKNVQIGTIFATLLLVMQFVDCLQRLKKLDYVSNPYYVSQNAAGAPPVFRGQLSNEQLASKFYSQRNLYITGAVLYLELAIATVMPILRKLVAKEEEYRKLTTVSTTSTNTSTTTATATDTDVAALKEQIAQKDTDISTFKKQVVGLQKAYDLLTEPTITQKSD